MDPENTLVVCIEYAIGVAGFGGLIASLRGKPENWTLLDRYRLANLLMFAFAAALLSFVTLFMLHLVESNFAYRMTSVVALILLLAQFLFTQITAGHLSDSDKSLIYSSKLLIVFSISFAAFAAGLQIANIGELLPGYGFNIVLTGIFFFLTFTTFQFLRAIFSVHRGDDA